MSTISTHLLDGTAVITLNRPESLNAWTMDMQRRIVEIVNELDEDPDVHALVITGAGEKAFCAGQDLKESSALTESDVDSWLNNFLAVYDAILSSKKPVIAALNGVAAGSGYQLAMVCDIRIGHEAVRIGQPEVSSGIPSITGEFLTNLSLGHSRTVELMLSGRLMEAREAYDVGIIHKLVTANAVLETALEYGRRLGSQPKLAFELTKRNIRDRMWTGLTEAFAVGAVVDGQAWASGEPQETARKFFEDRNSRKAASAAASAAAV